MPVYIYLQIYYTRGFLIYNTTEYLSHEKCVLFVLLDYATVKHRDEIFNTIVTSRKYVKDSGNK